MATQTTESTEQNQQTQEQGLVRETQGQMERPRRSSAAMMMPFSPADFFRMNSFSLMRRMTEELDRTFAEVNGREVADRAWAPLIEVTQQDGKYVVRAEVPGLNPKDVKLEITDDAIVIQGERKVEHQETEGGIHMTERRYGRFYRAIPLPEGAKVDEARAIYENGVLEVRVPTEEQKNKRREIPIQTSAEATGGQSAKAAGASGKAA
jgi:HSP20 family protein